MFELRKTQVTVEEIHHDGGPHLDRPLLRGAVAAVFKNPFAGRFADAGEFVAPNNMPQAIREFCRTSGQEPPESVGAVIRCALESLALRYRMVLNWTTELTGSNIDTIHIVGGGTQNRLLCQMAADACNCQVVAGPVEATAIGNVMMQVVSSGEVSSIEQAREVVRNSFDVEEYAPQQTQQWDDAYSRFEKLV